MMMEKMSMRIPGQWQHINNGQDEWFMQELSKLDNNSWQATKYCVVRVSWPAGDRLKSFVCKAEQYDNGSGTGFEIINFTPAIEWAKAEGINPAALRVAVDTEHTHVDDILGKIVEVDKQVNAKIKELEAPEEDEFYSDWR